MLGVAANRPARILLVGGCVLAVALPNGVMVEQPRVDGPVTLALSAAFVFAFVALTRRSAQIPAGALAAGGIAGVVTALVPAAAFLLRPPVPASGGWSLLLLAVAFGAAGLVTILALRHDLPAAVTSGMLAAVVTGLLVCPILTAMGRWGPVSWVPPIVSHALTPADRMAERRYLSTEIYVPALLLAALLAVILGITVLRMRPRKRPADAPRRTEPGLLEPGLLEPGLIELGEV